MPRATLSMAGRTGLRRRSVWIQASMLFLHSLLSSSFPLSPLPFSLFPSQSFYLSLFLARLPSCPFLSSENIFSQPAKSQPRELLFILENPAWACLPACYPVSLRLGKASLGSFPGLLGLSSGRVWWEGGWLGGPLPWLHSKPTLRRGPRHPRDLRKPLRGCANWWPEGGPLRGFYKRPLGCWIKTQDTWLNLNIR